MAIETITKIPANEPNKSSFKTRPTQAVKYRASNLVMPQYVREYLLRLPLQRRKIEVELRQRGEFVHAFSCFHCGFAMDENNICIACGLSSLRILKWIRMQPEVYSQLGEDDISEYAAEKAAEEQQGKQKYHTRSKKFMLGEDAD
ncbi:hypothetical protein ONS95_003587 [Cadophora gregata]|uniref:uncharacterized protein n=1 Tax=Cadophora gregata TaxID=51156 RepID=UPI0026DA9D7B|nr:uncharacterized protein ONS95_003587 [Cadophora gregata]KAK0106865.1 hypothetical protein ONS95_003587 [Cadophora gregata]KAK0116552.1 hypothetical protein ONS96_012410 [Cadophora gregata f. sp. sojae]